MNTRNDIASPVELGLALKRAQHLMAQRIDEVLRPLDLNLGLWAVLREVASMPGASASELARASFHTPQTLSGLVRRLADRGLVERSEARGRVVDNHLTAAGQDMLAKATQRVEEIIGSALTEFSPTQRQTLTLLAADFADALTRGQ